MLPGKMRTYTRKKVQEIEDVQTRCRLCLGKTEEMIPIFEANAEDVISGLPVRIGMCLGLEVSKDDDLPKFICERCKCELDKFYIFKKNCAATYWKLKANLSAARVGAGSQSCESNQNISSTFGAEGGEKSNTNDTGDSSQYEQNSVIVTELKIGNDDNHMYIATEEHELARSTADTVVGQCFINNSQLDEVKLNHDASQEHGGEKNEQSKDIKTMESLPAFIVTSLIDGGILAQQNTGLEIVDQNIKTFNLQTACGNEILMELVEEDQEVSAEGGSKPSGSKVFDSNGKSNGRCCGTCGARLSTRGALVRHQRIHSGEKPFSCRVCGRRFAQREVLRRHELLHADTLPYQCSWCPKAYTQRSALEAHVRTHAPPAARSLVLHRCSRCPKVFLYPSGLSRHMSVHQGRDYPCDECARTFNDKSSLQRHRRAHQRARTR